MRFKTGIDRNQQTMLPKSIEDYVTEENPVRVVDAYVESLDMKEEGFESEPKETGRPAFDPRDMLKLHVYGYMNRIRSSRRIEAETKRNIEVIWLVGGLRPDHKTIARFRKDNKKALRKVFHAFVKLCQEMGLYGNEIVGIDGSKFEAVNSLEHNYNEESLEEKTRRIDEKIEKYLSEVEENDEKERDMPEATEHRKEEITAAIAELKERKAVYEGMKEQLKESGEKQISTVDPDSRRMKVANGGSDVCYNVLIAVDEKNKLIANYEVTNQCNDKNQLAGMAISTKELLGVEKMAAMADTGFFVATDIAECMANGITAHVSSEYESVTFCLPSTREEAGEAVDFSNQGKNVYVRERNIGLCPMGNILYPRSYRESTGSAVYSNPKACRKCPHREHCKAYDRELKVKMPRAEFTKEYNVEDLYIRQITYRADKALLRRRKEIVEHPFGTIKRSMDARYCLLRGIPKVTGEFALIFLAYNMKRAINILGVQPLVRYLQAVKARRLPFFVRQKAKRLSHPLRHTACRPISTLSPVICLAPRAFPKIPSTSCRLLTRPGSQ